MGVTAINTAISITWLFYGCVLFFSKSNNCMVSVETKSLDLMMMGLLLLGFMKVTLIVSIAICYLIFNCCLGGYLQRRETLDNTQIANILESMKSQLYDPELHNHDDEC